MPSGQGDSFKRYGSSDRQVSAHDQNRRAIALEALTRISASPPLNISRTAAGIHIWMAIPRGRTSHEARITARSVADDNAILPSDAKYDVEPLDGLTAPAGALENMVPKYGRVVKGDEGMIYPAKVGDRCRVWVEQDPTPPGGPAPAPRYELEVISEKLAGGECDEEPADALSSPQPNVRLGLIARAMRWVGLVPAPQEEGPSMSRTFVHQSLGLNREGATTDWFDVSDAGECFVSAKLLDGEWGAAVVSFEEAGPHGVAAELPLNAQLQPAQLTTDQRALRLNIAASSRVRGRVRTPAGADGTADIEFFSKRAK